jgi:hypothetical protein
VQVGGTIATKAELEALIAAMAHAPDAAANSATALAAVLTGVITGEGPTTQGRIHYSRCVDAHDTALVKRILLADGDRAIARAEADLLFDIHDAALDHADGGTFADLFARAVMHHVLVASGLPVPVLSTALGQPLATWAPQNAALTNEPAAWLAARLRRRRRAPGVLAALAAALGLAAPRSVSVATVVDFAA